LQCRSCGEKLDHLIIAGKWGAYEKALCPHPECGEPYRYRGFNKKSGHEWLIVSDDNNSTIYKCVRCGAWYETRLGDIVYQSHEAQYNCVK
jgi:hypothetical protein